MSKRLVERPKAPPLTAGTLLMTRSQAQAFASLPPTQPLGYLPKKAQVVSLGETRGDLGRIWVKVMGPLGACWVRLRELEQWVEGTPFSEATGVKKGRRTSSMKRKRKNDGDPPR